MTAPSLRWFFRAVLGYTVAAIALFFAATWRAETVFDSKHGLGDLRTFKLWNAIAGRALLVAAYARSARGDGALRRRTRFALGLPLGVFLAGVAATLLPWF